MALGLSHVEEDRPDAVRFFLLNTREQPPSTLNKGTYDIDTGENVCPVRADFDPAAGLVFQHALYFFRGVFLVSSF